MKESNTYFQICVSLTIAIVVFTLAVNFVVGLGVFPVDIEMGFVSGRTANETFADLTNTTVSVDAGIITGMDALWVMVLTGGGLASLFVAWITRSTTILGVYVLSAVFWTSYIRCNSILNFGQYLPNEFLVMGHVVVFFVFAGAVGGMLSGSG